MNQNERVDASLRNQPRTDHRLSESGRSRQDTGVVACQRLCGNSLLLAELAREGEVALGAALPFITNRHPDPEAL